jgi:hypothetical protein
MEIRRTVDAVARVVVLEVIGDLGDPELASLVLELTKVPGLEPDFALLIDMREARGRAVTTSGVKALAQHPLVLSPASRRAVVVPTDLGFGMARMYEMFAEPRGGAVRVFRDYAQARRWVELGV